MAVNKPVGDAQGRRQKAQPDENQNGRCDNLDKAKKGHGRVYGQQEKQFEESRQEVQRGARREVAATLTDSG
jgi:hypothetical protein